MEEMKELICIGCPKGCKMEIKVEDGNKVLEVTGHTCKKGEAYAIKEITNPTRIITSTVKLKEYSGTNSQVSVKTETDIPKGKIFEIMDQLKGVTVSAPIKVGDVIVENIADTGVNIVATRNVS